MQDRRRGLRLGTRGGVGARADFATGWCPGQASPDRIWPGAGAAGVEARKGSVGRSNGLLLWQDAQSDRGCEMKRLGQIAWLVAALWLLPALASAQEGDAPASAPADGEAKASALEPAAAAPADGAVKASAPEPAAVALAADATPLAKAAANGGHESDCTDRKDDDFDSMTDCADSDCAAAPACQAGGGFENTDALCTDWVDNDGDGAVDCDDADCEGPAVAACKGSWRGPTDTGGGAASAESDEGLPDLGAGMTVEDLIGRGGDKDGERNDVLCSDGLDNDGDGRADCADFGCRFDPSVTVCRGNPAMRFSIVANVAQFYDLEAQDSLSAWDTRFTKLQLRSFGPINLIQNSFYLVSMRAEKTPRLTFAMFQVPLHGAHYLNINSGGGGLSNALVVSSSKQLLLDAPYYVYNAFEQGNGAALEVGGPLGSGAHLSYRAFVAGGSGRFAGNVGGVYYTYNNMNFTYSAGAQLGVNIIGMYSRWDTPFLYTPVPMTLGFTLGAKYDQRAQERYPATNASAVFRWNRFVAIAENYSKWELEFESFQTAYNIQVGFLLWPKYLLIAADFGEYIAGDMKNPPAKLETDLKKQLDERQWRAALHWYFLRNIGVATLLYTDRTVENAKGGDPLREREVRLEAQYRF